MGVSCYVYYNQPSTTSNIFLFELENQQERTSVRRLFNTSLKGEFHQHKTSLITNRTCSQYCYLIILVSSAPGNFERRNNIRKTWARDNELKWPRWKTFFLLGQTQMKNVSHLLLKEDKAFGDLVRGEYVEHYWNQTYKIQMGFEWAIKYCEFSFLLKADDDVFVDTARVISFLSEPATPRREFYTGHVMRKVEASRNTGKWYVSKAEYTERYYPDYCSGFAFILSYDVIALFVELFDFLPVFKIDDAYVGMLAAQTGIRVVHQRGFEPWPAKDTLCVPLAHTLARHGTLGECLIEIFNRTTRIEGISFNPPPGT